MVKAVPDILAQILQRKQAELLQQEIGDPIVDVLAELSIPGRRDFRAALLAQPIAVIAEIKKASPSRGLIAADFDPPSIAQSYERGGAAALSVLTDRDYFQGSLSDMVAARAAVGLPVLRKDFTTAEYDVLDGAAHGADAILLIAAALNGQQLRRFRELAESYRMAALVEVHDEDELHLAIDSGASIIGVNSRDLRTFQVDLNVALRLAPSIPASVIKVAESGIHSASDVQTLAAAGYRGFLVGEHLMRAPDPAQALRDLFP